MQRDQRKELQMLLEQEIQREQQKNEGKRSAMAQEGASFISGDRLQQPQDNEMQATPSKWFPHDQWLSDKEDEPQDMPDASSLQRPKYRMQKPLLLLDEQPDRMRFELGAEITTPDMVEMNPPVVPPSLSPNLPRRKIHAVRWILLAAVLILATTGVLAFKYSASVQSDGQTDGIYKDAIVLYRPLAIVNRWDVVVTKDGEVGRVVGLPEDWVFVQGETGHLYINTYLIAEDENIIYGENTATMKDAVYIPENSVYLLGDDRTASMGRLVLKTELLGSVIWVPKR